MEKVDRHAVLVGDLDIWLKEPQKYLNEDWEIGIVKHIVTGKIAIIEKEGKCYVAIKISEYTLTGFIYETRDSFDDLVAQYQKKETGGNAPTAEE